jgi:hypothetical protein
VVLPLLVMALRRLLLLYPRGLHHRCSRCVLH